ncbi:hypothetical protein Y717_03345 [Streptomyces scopuliridis RB72]|uniref:Uncharacterized protein n=1 Tax=Streptomyces scopuliridis RB72 TaxID=1440053 RepID=A0A2T7TB77_9ACTN|nr:hypothetical protein Y717_03345 [Streptomyces scopuliridis RB72]
MEITVQWDFGSLLGRRLRNAFFPAGVTAVA